MKSALFSGISAKKKDDSSDDEKEKKKEEEPVNEINLLDMDAGPSQAPATTGDLLDTNPSPQNMAPATDNLLDVMGGVQPPATTGTDQNLTSQFDSILNLGSAPQQQPVLMQPKFTGIPGFVTANFGQAWMQMQNPAAESKFTLPCPPSISQGINHPEGYSAILQQKIGILKVEVINNEV